MDQKACNTSIKCTVSSCVYHNDPQDYCSLDAIKVGCTESVPTEREGTECASFKLDSTK